MVRTALSLEAARYLRRDAGGSDLDSPEVSVLREERGWIHWS